MKRLAVRAFKAFALAAVLIGLAVPIVNALEPGWGHQQGSLGGKVGFWGLSDQDVFIDPVPDDTINFESLSNKVTLWVAEDGAGDPTGPGMVGKATMITGLGGPLVPGTPFRADRAEVGVMRTSFENGTAGMQSSSNARVVVEEGGDVVITLGE